MLGIDAELEISFPEITTPDKSQKLKDLSVAESQQWFSKSRCANIAAKEMGVTDFDFDKEKIDMEKEKEEITPSLARPIPTDNNSTNDSSSMLSGNEKQEIRDDGQQL